MVFYYKTNESEDTLPPLYKGFQLQKIKKSKECGPKINYDFSKHVLIELLDDTTPEEDLWSELGLMNNNNVIHKRMMVDPHRIKCRRAIVILINYDEANLLVQRISQTTIMDRSVCAVVIQNLLSDLCLFEKQVIQFGDRRHQHQLLYVSDLSRCRGPAGLVKFLKEKFSPFGTILSVLICSDDDGYAFPEGVIKFAYLSEAFAAELAFDQYVVGKERLSVTSHHNILLSQCDLRVRLRDAHRRNSNEYSSLNKSPVEYCDQSYDQNDLSTTTISQQQCNSHDPVVNSMSNLRICHSNDDLVTTESNLPDDKAEVSFPAFSQYTFKINLPNEQSTCSPFTKSAENTTCFMPVFDSDLNNDKSKNVDNANCDSFSNTNHESLMNISETIPLDGDSTKNISNLIKESFFHAFSKKCLNSGVLPSQNKKSRNEQQDKNTSSHITKSTENTTCLIPHLNNDKSKNIDNTNSHSFSHTNHETLIHNISETLPLVGDSTKNISYLIKESFSHAFSKKCLNSEVLPSHNKKSSGNKSDCDSFITCDTFPDTNSSSKNTLYNTNEINSMLEYKTVSDCKEIPSSLCDSLNGSKVVKEKSGAKTSKKKRKKFNPSQKLCLKSQRTALSQCDVQSTTAKSEITVSSSSQPETETKKNKLTANNVSMVTVAPDSSGSLKVAKWLSNIPDVQNTAHSCDKEEKMEIEQINKKRNRISVYKAPSIKSNLILPPDHKITISDESSVENEDPNINNVTLTDKREPAPLTGKLKSPLQTWLKAEIMSSTNNTVFRSEETFKSFIICATGTKDVIINVGCSYMTCEACYPESTDLLLGYK